MFLLKSELSAPSGLRLLGVYGGHGRKGGVLLEEDQGGGKSFLFVSPWTTISLAEPPEPLTAKLFEE